MCQPEVPEDMPSKIDLWQKLKLTDVIKKDTVVYVCLQTLFKLVPDFDEVFRFVKQS